MREFLDLRPPLGALREVRQDVGLQHAGCEMIEEGRFARAGRSGDNENVSQLAALRRRSRTMKLNIK